MQLEIEVLNSSHDRSKFCCCVEQLDRYLIYQANQDLKRKLSVCFVLVDGTVVKGYFTLSNNGIDRSLLPDSFIKKLPNSYHSLPTTLLGRLAVETDEQGRGYGELLLLDALKKSYESSKALGSIAVIVDPIDETAIKFYLSYGFILLPGSGKMFLPMKTIASLFSNY
jgi:GNAT superfamily N-acetyltransferase